MLKNQFPSDLALTRASKLLGCDLPIIKAVAHVESGTYGAFHANGEPVILFEPHWFSQLTGGKYDWMKMPIELLEGVNANASNQTRWRTISRPHWTATTYGPLALQHVKLRFAATLDREAALQACSWGLFQVLGVNYKLAGHSTLQSFINAAYRSPEDHLYMFVNFILSIPKLTAAIRAKDWRTFTYHYNGPGQVDIYSTRLRTAYTLYTK